MKLKTFTVLLLLLVSGCASRAASQAVAPNTSPSPAATVLTGGDNGSSQRLNLRLTLSSPADLKVEEGDRIEAGEVLADRVRERQQIQTQLDKLRLQMAQLQQPIPGPPSIRPIPEVAGLPSASFLDEVANVERQRTLVTAAEAAVMNQQRMLDMLTGMDNSQIPQATIPHEEEVLKQKQQLLNQARADLQLAEAQLGQAQSERQFQEYQHSLEMSKRAISIQQAELQRQEEVQHQQAELRDRAYDVAQLEAQIQNLETQLFTLSAVRSPYAGTIQRVKFEGQNDQSLIVELVLVTGDISPSSGTGTAPTGTPAE
ncbi:MAG: hypothetical protein HC879_09850 [Leptolyngbyaceae cyanobacterium SL_5_9]|nr:hypothetical protein [Leptolyngbyaceae cyanobacterium SL_5_9]NJO74830.1 hypothetical protein [Leptolyngbyaceae cyanobacterium RM1_406_9]